MRAVEKMGLFRYSSNKKLQKEFNYKCSLEKPEFTDSQKVTLRSIMAREDGVFTVEYWRTVHDYLLWHLAQRLLNGQASDDYRRGYMDCLSQLDNLPIFDVTDQTAELEKPDDSMMEDY